MQIVRDLAGYTLGRSDLVRRAMAKKKAAVMEKERQNFVYGNPEEGVTGCVANGIDEKIANHIYDEMIDFAKYAFNKSHAAAYAVVSYQTAYLKYYYPAEFMAALMTSVMDNLTKLSEYIVTCRQMGIAILPPDINSGESGFSVDGEGIRYGLSAIKSIGKSVVEMIVKERENNGKFRSLEDFVERMSSKEVNKRTMENFIRSGALDCLPGNRRQKVLIAPEIIDNKNREKKNSMAGQMSLFDFADESEKTDFQITFPDVEEFTKEDILAGEKETLGIYISGHPLEAYVNAMKNNTNASAVDFLVDEETNLAALSDGQRVIIGGMVTDKTIKTTKTGKMMAFLTIEDLTGSVEVLVFPKNYEAQREVFTEDAKLFVQGRVSLGEEPVGKLILEKAVPFSKIPRELWIKFSDMEDYRKGEQKLLDSLSQSEGNDAVVIYLEKERAKKILPVNWNVEITKELTELLSGRFGETNVRIVEKKLTI